MSAEKLFRRFKDNQMKYNTGSILYKVKEIQIKCKLEIHWSKAFSIKNSLIWT